MCIFSLNNYSHSDFLVDHCSFEYFFTGIDIRSQINGLTATFNTFGPQELPDCQAAAAGIYIGDGPNGLFDIDNILISDNDFVNTARGVYMWNYAAGEMIKKVDITDNTFTNSIWSSPIRFIGRTSVLATLEGPITIEGNEFIQNTGITNGNGIAMVDIRAGLESLTSQVYIKENLFDFSGTLPLSTWGVSLRGLVTNVEISGNVMDGNLTGGSSPNMPATSGIVLQTDFSGFGPLSANANIDIKNNFIREFVNGIAAYDFVNNVYGNMLAAMNVK